MNGDDACYIHIYWCYKWVSWMSSLVGGGAHRPHMPGGSCESFRPRAVAPWTHIVCCAVYDCEAARARLELIERHADVGFQPRYVMLQCLHLAPTAQGPWPSSVFGEEGRQCRSYVG